MQKRIFFFLAVSSILFCPSLSFAHCDTMNGPVVKSAQKALDSGNVDLALIWVDKKYEPQARKAFIEAFNARKANPKNWDKTDMRFFETLVRLHREGEGEEYTGIKSDDTEVSPAIKEADQALDFGLVEKLVKDMTNEVSKGIRERFALVMEKSIHRNENLKAGREYVKAYVEFIRYVEKIYDEAPAGLRERVKLDIKEEPSKKIDREQSK